MSNVLVVGGFTESKRLLEPVAQEAVALGFGHDASVLTLREAWLMDEERLRSRMAGAAVLTHSAGLMAVPDMRKRVGENELPEDFMAIASPEPRSIPQLANQATLKTVDHVFGDTPYPRRAHLKVVAGNTAELMAHPIQSASLVPAASRFSTMALFGEGKVAANRRLASFMMSDDIFYADPDWPQYAVLQDLARRGCTIAEIFGKHDELLVSPGGVLRDIRQEFKDAGN